MTQKFHSKVAPITNWIIWLSISAGILSIIPIIEHQSFWFKFTFLTFISLFCWVLLSVRYNTYYYFEGNKMIWVTGFFKGTIDVTSIQEISRSKSWINISSTIKPILSNKCLLIRYTTYDDIPVSPENEKEFLQKIKEINPEIEMSL